MGLAAAIPDIAISTPLWLALITTGVGAVQGAIIGHSAARDERIDIVGMSVFALLLGLGGGMARDTMLGNTPFVALRTPWYVLTVGLAVLLVLVVRIRFLKFSLNATGFLLLDALTLGLYTAIGTQWAIDFKVSWVGAILVGTVSGVTGGIIVAVLRGQTPSILVSGPPYALLGVVGSSLYIALYQFGGGLASVVSIGAVMLLRMVTLRYGITTPITVLSDEGEAVRGDTDGPSGA